MAVSSPWSRVVVQFLASRGIPVHIVDVNNSMDEPYLKRLADQMLSELQGMAAGVHILNLPQSPGLRLLAGARAVRRFANRANARLVLCLYGGAQAATAWLSGVRPYAVYVVGSDVLISNGPRDFIARRALSAASTVIANGANLRERTSSLLDGRSVELLYLGIDLTRFRPPTTPRETPRPLRFVCSRAFNAVYDNATIVRAFATLTEAVPDASLEFLSTGPLLPETQLLAGQLLPPHRRDSIRFAGGASDDRLLSALQDAAYYISASLSDGASASLMEAMACGLFPIVSDIPANREWIAHGRTGLMFEPGKPEALRACLELAAAGIPWMDDAIVENYAKVAQLADFDRNLQQLTTLLELEQPSAAAQET